MDIHQTNEQAAADNKARREARENDRKAQEEQIKKDAEERNKMNMAVMEREAKYRPTPTPEEISLATAGHIVDHKENDGAPLQNERHAISNPAQQIEVGRETPTAKPVDGSDTNRSGVSPSSSSSGGNAKPASSGNK